MPSLVRTNWILAILQMVKTRLIRASSNLPRNYFAMLTTVSVHDSTSCFGNAKAAKVLNASAAVLMKNDNGDLTPKLVVIGWRPEPTTKQRTETKTNDKLMYG